MRVVIIHGLLAALTTWLVAYLRGEWPLEPSPTSPWGWLPMPLAALGLLGGLWSRNPTFPAHGLWRAFWCVVVAATWLLGTVAGLQDVLVSLSGFGPSAIRLLAPAAITSSLLVGYLWTLHRKLAGQDGEAAWLALALPLALLPLLLVNTEAVELAPLPLLAAAGLVPWGSPRRSPWPMALASVLEMISFQTVAWGLTLTLLGFLAELWRGSFWSALVVGCGTGVSAWLLSGLLWGLSDTLRRRTADVSDRPI